MTHNNNHWKDTGVTNPHTPLITDYEVTWNDLDAEQFALNEGEYFERGLVEFDNGYVVSIVRHNVDRDGIVPSLGVEDGKWEAVIVRPTTNALYRMQGMDFEPAPELDHLTNTTIEGGFQLSVMDDTELNALFAGVQQAEKYEAPEGEGDELANSLFEAIFGGAQE
jgi:hypothetical protein